MTPNRAPERTPSSDRHALALLTWAAIFPLITIVLFLTEPLLQGRPLVVRTFLVTALVVPTMVYAVMPALTRIALPWLRARLRLARTLTALAGVAVVLAATPAVSDSGDEAAIRARTLTWVESWRTSPEQPFDLSRFEHIYARDETFSSLDFGRPHAGFEGWDEAAAYYRRFMAIPRSWRLEANDDLRVFVRGDVAWSKLSLRARGELRDGTAIDAPESRVTLIFERRGGEWLIVHEHGSAALPFPTKSETRALLEMR